MEEKTHKPEIRKEKADSNLQTTVKASGKIALILIRGTLGLKKEIKDTLKMLNLHGKYNLVILENNPVNNGMVKKVKDFTTFGEVSPEVEKLLEEKRPKGDKKYYRLHPPRGGLERKGSKKTYAQKGALGPRGAAINDLIKRMI